MHWVETKINFLRPPLFPRSNAGSASIKTIFVMAGIMAAVAGAYFFFREQTIRRKVARTHQIRTGISASIESYYVDANAYPPQLVHATTHTIYQPAPSDHERLLNATFDPTNGSSGRGDVWRAKQ